jgi:quercetin dioxygenase-like cupin family protein
MEGTPRPFTTAIERELPGGREMTSSWFRQTRVTLAPGDTTVWLRTSRTVVAILPFDGHTLIEREGGETNGLSMPGAFTVIKAGERYRVRNPSRTTTPVVLVQPH